MKTGRSSRVFRDFFPGNLCRETRVNLFFFFFASFFYIHKRAYIYIDTHIQTRENRIKLYTMEHISRKIRGPGLSVIFPFFFLFLRFFFFFFFLRKKILMDFRNQILMHFSNQATAKKVYTYGNIH